jgi:hypothetical protein
MCHGVTNEIPLAVDLDVRRKQVLPRVGKLEEEGELGTEYNIGTDQTRVLLPGSFTEISLNGAVLRMLEVRSWGLE